MSWIIYDKTGKTKRCTVHQLEYNGTFMGECHVICNVKSPAPIGFEIGDYIVYRGERFEINYDPALIKRCRTGFSDEAFVYNDIKLNSLSDELTRCDFLDYVLSDNQIHFTALPKFSFYASSVKDLADRIQANLDRVYKGGQRWTVNVNPEFVSKTNINVSSDNLNVWEALALAYSQFDATFIIKGRVITIGSSGRTADHLFKYGKGKGLCEIERQTEHDQLIVTRLRVYGSTKNLPNRYYNKLTKPDGSAILPDNMAVQNLMLPGFPRTTLDPYIDSTNLPVLGVREHTLFFDGSEEGLEEIYPSLEGMTADQLRAAGVTVGLDAGDNGKLDEVVSAEQVADNGILPEKEEIKGTFTITIKDVGFDINKYLTDETAVISMKDGMCGGREFEIAKCEKKGNKYELTCNREEDTSIGRVFPYKDYNIKKGDKFVLLHISMPDVYINAASQRMKNASDEWLKKHDFVRYSYFPKVDDIFMARQHDDCVSLGKASIHDTIKEGDLMLFEDTEIGINGAVIIDTLSIKEGEYSIPKYSVVLKDEKTVGTIEKIQQTIESIKAGANGGGYNLEQIIAILKNHGAKIFLRKDQPDVTNHLISLLAGALFGNYSEGVSGAKIDERGKSELADLIVRGRVESPHYNPGLLGSGYVLKYDKDTGRSYMEVDELAVRMKAVFAALEIRKLTYAGGNWVFSAAGAKCTRVEEFGGYYRCFFTAEYGSQRVENEFRVDDQVRYQEGNFALGTTPNASNHFGWRKVVGLGEDYIDLSKTDCMANSDAPASGDDLVQLGNRTDAQRQNAIVISAYGEGSPSITQHKGINSYSLAGTEKTRISPQKNVFTGELHFESGVNVEEQVGSQGEQILEALEQAAENNRFANAIKKDVDAIKNQVDGIIETWFLDPVPTLSNKPAVDWTTDAEKKKHIGDMYYDANGKAYRFSDRGGKYQWETITDSDIIKALEAAKKAQDTADGKRRVFVEIPSSSSVYDVGDLWVNATYGSYVNELLKCKTAKTSGVPFDISHWEKACKYTDDTTANNAAAQADQAKKDAAIAQNNANIAISNANKANGMLADIASDSKLTASEKQQTKKEWDVILSEKPKNDASADRYGVSKAAYGTAYASLKAYITPLLDSLTTTSNIVGADFRGKFKAYYDARTDLLNAISAKTKEIADAAQSAADAAAQKAQQALEQVIENKSFANAIKKDLDALKNQVDGVIETWFLDPVPTLSNKPAVDWTTESEKQKHIGDLYYDANGKAYRFSNRSGKYQWEVLADSDVAKALEAAKKAQDTADGKRRVFVVVPTASSAYDVGDLWVNATYANYKNELLRCKSAKTSGVPFDISHWEKACNYTDDTVANNAASIAEQAKKDAAAAQNKADTASANANKANALLSDIASDSKLTAQEKQQTKKEWDIIVSEKPKNDASADRYGVSKAAYGAAYSALSAYITPLLSSLSTTSNITGNTFRANFKAYYDARTDLLNAVSAKSKQIADAAQEAADAAADKAQQALEQAIENIKFSNAIKKDLDALKNQVDGVIETWFFDPVPTLTNQPAVNWNTTEEKQKHIGDLYYDKNGKAYRFSNRGGTFQWEVLADSDVAKALEAAKKAQDTADGKRRVFVAVPTASNAYDVGDLWVNATYGSYVNELLKCKTAKSSGAAFSISHWEKACKYTDDTTANAAVQKAQQAKEAADVAQNAANKAKQDAVQALDKLTEIADDNKFTASEKQQTKKEWDIIVSEKPKNDASADRYGVSKAAYGAAYNSLSAYITPLLATLTATSPVVGTDFRRNFKSYYDARTDLLNAISSKAKELADRALQEAGQAASKAEQAKADAAAAQSKANSAHTVADAAKNRLNSWAADGSISPVEKHAIKDEVIRVDADKSEILADYNRYAISSPSHFVSQHAAYRGMLVSLSAATPEMIAIPSGFAAQQKSYYDARTACLNAIAIAAKKYADDTVGALRTETKASIDALNNKISLKVDSSTFNSLKQQVQAQGSELQLAKDEIKAKVSQSTFDAEKEKQNILAACNDANMVTDDPSFARGTNDILVYNNTDNGAVTIARKVGCGVNSSNYYLDIAAAATGAIEPGYGGFTFRYQTKARLRLVCRFSAWLDKGRRFEFATNAIGDNSRHFWLTDNVGKGTWADYAYYVECGTGGSFSSTFFFYVMGGSRPVSTWLSYATIHMLSADTDFKHRLSTAETKITQTANSISLKADKSYVDGINNRLSSAEIALNPDQIWMKVSEKVTKVAIDKSKRKTVLIDAMSLDQNIYYPVIIPMTTTVPQYRIKVYRTLNSLLGVPGWSNHTDGFSLMVSWVTNASGWGTIDIKRIIEEAVHWHSNVVPVGSIGQLSNGSVEYIYVRGGSKYYFEIEGATDVGVYLKTGSYTNNGQTVAPQTKVTFPQREQPTREEIKAGIGVTAGGVTVFGKTISLNGVVTFASLASDAQGKINTAQSTATAAQNTANTARSEKIALARLEGTIIDGGYIKTSLINVKSLFAEEITATKFNLAGGSIGGFVVSGNSLSSANGAYGESGSRFFLHSKGSGDNGAFLGFRSDNKWVGLGLNCFSSVVGETCLMRLENTKSETSLTHSKTGLYIDVAGAGVYDDSGMGNNAIWIRRGHIAGLRRRAKRTNSNPTNLKNEDNIVICMNTYADMVVNLPPNPEDGQEVWMISANEKAVQVRTTDGSNITNPGRRFTDMRWNVYIYDAISRTWWYSFMNR